MGPCRGERRAMQHAEERGHVIKVTTGRDGRFRWTSTAYMKPQIDGHRQYLRRNWGTLQLLL